MPRRAELPNLNPARLDIPNYRGDSLSAKLTFQSQGVPIDVSLWIFEAYIRASIDGPKIAEFTVFKDEANGGDAEEGIIRLVLPYQAAQLLPAACVWDLQVTEIDPIGQRIRVQTVLRGFIYTTADVTYADDDQFSVGQSARG